MIVVDQLWDFYEKETWHQTRLTKAEADVYHSTLLDRGNIITVSNVDFLLGYVEYWRLSFEQFGRIVCGEPFSAIHEDVQRGQVAYVANTYIRPEWRSTKVYRLLRDRFFEANRACTHFVGEARRKKSAPIKVFRREDIMRFNKVEGSDGQG